MENIDKPWWVKELESIFSASRGSQITDDMKRSANIALKIVRGEKWDDKAQAWIPGPPSWEVAAPQVTALGQVHRAKKIGGSYQAEGTIVSTFATLAGETRHVFEFDQPTGMLHIFGPGQVEIAAAPQVVADERKLPPLPQYFPDIVNIRADEELRAQDYATQYARAALQAAPVQAQEPFMFGIMGPDGKAHMDEHCVAPDAASLYDELNGLNDSPDTGYIIVPLYRASVQPVAVPDCGACPGDGTICPKSCKLAEDSPPIATPAAQGDVKDAERYRWLRSVGPDQQRVIAHYGMFEMDKVIDAAIAAKAAS